MKRILTLEQKEARKIRAKERYRKDSNKALFYAKRWQENNKGKAFSYRKSQNGRYSRFKAKCKNRGRTLSLSLGQCIELWSQPCFYCFKVIDNTSGYALDRLDNSKDYTLGNVVPCCKTCNWIRKDSLTSKEMSAGMEAVLAFRKV